MTATPEQMQNEQHKADVISAYCNGASIEQRQRMSRISGIGCVVDYPWCINDIPQWDWVHFDYRISADVTPGSDVDCFGEPVEG